MTRCFFFDQWAIIISSFEKWYARSCVSDAIYEIIIEMILIVGKFMICNIQWDRLSNKFNVNSCSEKGETSPCSRYMRADAM